MSTDNDDLVYTNKDVGIYIAKIRKNKGWSMYKLALHSGISNSVLMRIEKGQREPKINTLLRIIDGLAMSPSDFFKSFR